MTLERHRGLTEQASDAAVDQACRMLWLPTIRAQFSELAEAAARDQTSLRAFDLDANPNIDALATRRSAARSRASPVSPG
ncbi:hypothetical protein GA0115254_10931 [Streptomyces sp. Ncost-T10-10d]|nr:hypothetical protein GA0115254_10931 [Streptomyces sp. Ncost-T10-10d]